MKNVGVLTGIRETKVVNEDGEVLSESVEHVVLQKLVNGNERFWMSFESTFKKRSEMDKVSILVFEYFGIESSERELKFTATKFYKQLAAAKLGMAYSTVANAIQRLYTMDCIRRVNPGVYLINPLYFWKGGINKRPEAYLAYLQHKCGKPEESLTDNFEKEKGGEV